MRAGCDIDDMGCKNMIEANIPRICMRCGSFAVVMVDTYGCSKVMMLRHVCYVYCHCIN